MDPASGAKKPIRLPQFSTWRQDQSRKVLPPGQRGSAATILAGSSACQPCWSLRPAQLVLKPLRPPLTFGAPLIGRGYLTWPGLLWAGKGLKGLNLDMFRQ